jgi:glycerophosphoryl diester phosphodiesterase
MERRRAEHRGTTRVMNIAHRGARAVAPENTIEAIEKAAGLGADMVEIDVHLSRDGALVVTHDLPERLTLADIQAKDPRIPTLPQCLARALELSLLVNVEIKNLPGEPSFDSPREAAVEATLALLEEVRFEGPVLVSSFNWLSIERAKERAAHIPTGLITRADVDPWAALVYVREKSHDVLLPNVAALSAAGRPFLEAAHDDAIRVGTWTVDDPEAVRDLFEMGVDAIATNDPAMAVPIRRRFRPDP